MKVLVQKVSVLSTGLSSVGVPPGLERAPSREDNTATQEVVISIKTKML